MHNIKKNFILLFALVILCLPIYSYANDESSKNLEDKNSDDFVFLVGSESIEVLDLAIELSKERQISETEIAKEIEKQESEKLKAQNEFVKLASHSKDSTSMLSYIMRKNSSLSKEDAQKIYDSVIKHSSAYGVDKYIVFAIIEQESTFKPNTEYQGAYGLMQIYHSTMPYLGITMSEVYDIDKNIGAGVREISQHLNTFKDETIALTAYNWGSGNVKKGNYNTKYANSVLKRKENIKAKVLGN